MPGDCGERWNLAFRGIRRPQVVTGAESTSPLRVRGSVGCVHIQELDMTDTKLPPIDVNGMAHVNLTVSHFSAALEFYEQLLPFFGLQKVMQTDTFVYWVGGRTGLAIQRCAPEYSRDVFVQARVGLHHLCFRAREHDDIDAAARFLKEIGAKIVRGPKAGEWAPGYYYVLFEDPDGIRLEICHVPGRGLLKEGVSFNNASKDY